MAVPALAHADLASSTPKDGARLDTPPTTVELTFTEGLVQAKSSIRLVGPDGEVGTAKPARDGAKVIRLEDLALGPGEYTVKWTAGADDGHVERGTIRFTVTGAAPTSTPSVVPTDEPATPAPPTDAPPTDAPASEPAPTDVPASPAPASEAPAASPAPDPEPAAATGLDVLIPIVAALVLVGGVGVLVLRRSRAA